MVISDNSSIVVQLWQNMAIAAFGTLEASGLPHVSMVTSTPQNNGSALLLLSDLARHTANIKRDNRASLLVQADTDRAGAQNADIDPLACDRITVNGAVEILPFDQQENGKVNFVKHHPAAGQYVGFQDFNLYAFHATEIYLVGGFGRIETFSAEVLST